MEISGDLDNLIQLICNELEPLVGNIEVSLSQDISDLKMVIILIRRLISLITKLKSLSDLDQSNFDVVLADGWILIGCLQLKCICSLKSLDPYMIKHVKQKSIQKEVSEL